MWVGVLGLEKECAEESPSSYLPLMQAPDFLTEENKQINFIIKISAV